MLVKGVTGHYLIGEVSFCDIHLRAISQEMLMNLIRRKCSEITLLKSLPQLSSANDLNTRLTRIKHALETLKFLKSNFICTLLFGVVFLKCCLSLSPYTEIM